MNLASRNFVVSILVLSVSVGISACSSKRAASEEVAKGGAAASPNQDHALIQWQPWDDRVFDRARKEKKLVLLDLKAIWCHWCHVMDEKTYADPRVAALLNQHFIATHVDQDSRPDLAARYEDYGWPATILFNSDGQEIAKKSGYIAPDQMVELLRTLVVNPKPMEEESVATPAVLNPSLSNEFREKLETEVLTRYDQKQGSWDVSHKFVDAGFADLFLSRALHGEKRATKWLKQTLDQNLKLHDPIWGGVYQYSTGRVWNEPHFEKIMSVQADNIRIYAQASLVLNSPRYLTASKKTADYINEFLTSPEGAFYTSQDADLIPGQHSERYFSLNDEERRKLGVPSVDKHIYARENGWMISALTSLYAASGDSLYLERAKKSAIWIGSHRALSGGGFSHGEKDSAGPYLGDTVAMGLAFLKLYQVTGERHFYQDAVKAAAFLDSKFKNGKAGYNAAVTTGLATKPMGEENLQVARFANLLFRYSGDIKHQEIAKHALKFLTIPDIADDYYITAGLLQVASEVETAPVHIALVAPKSDLKARDLWLGALRFPLFYQRVDWWDRAEGPLPANDVTYPELSRAAVFTCTESRCSLPAFELSDVQKRIGALSK